MLKGESFSLSPQFMGNKKMATIIKKGTCASCFRLKSGRMIMLQPDVIVTLKEADYEELMKEYGSFITPRILTDKNPTGCFIVSTKIAKAKDQSKEVGKVKDGSAPIEVKDGVVKASKKAKK